ncbi:MAG: NUDIX hydrolase [Candidatus Hodarchaeales archaeon]
MLDSSSIADRISDLLNNRKPKSYDLDNRRLAGFRPASVMLLITADKGNRSERIVFTKRTANVTSHKSQISLPGGRNDNSIDSSLLDTAIRETREEIGIGPDCYRILGRLDDSITNSGYVVTPFVGYTSKEHLDYVLMEDEVESVIEVPISHLCSQKKGYYWTKWRIYMKHLVKLYFYRYDEKNTPSGTEIQTHIIWGVTGRIVASFLKIIKKDRMIRNYFLKEVD